VRRYIAVLAALTLIVVLARGAELALTKGLNYYGASPLNNEPFGTSYALLILNRSGFYAYTINDWLSFYLTKPSDDYCTVFVVISPTKPFAPIDAMIFRALVDRGVNAVLADEVGTINTLINALGLNVSISGAIVFRSPFIETVLAGNRSIPVVFGTSSFIDGSDERCLPIATHEDEVIAVRCVYGKSSLAIFADGDPFLNNALAVESPLNPSRILIAALIRDLCGDRGGAYVVFDAAHYSYRALSLSEIATLNSDEALQALLDPNRVIKPLYEWINMVLQGSIEARLSLATVITVIAVPLVKMLFRVSREAPKAYEEIRFVSAYRFVANICRTRKHEEICRSVAGARRLTELSRRLDEKLRAELKLRTELLRLFLAEGSAEHR